MTAAEMCKSAAFLVAALHHERVIPTLPRESKDAAAILLAELDEAGYMAAYRGVDGTLVI